MTEILKHAEWATTPPTAYHYRQRDEEIDLILENRAGEIAAIEVKATASSTAKTSTIERLRDARATASTPES